MGMLFVRRYLDFLVICLAAVLVLCACDVRALLCWSVFALAILAR
jgi:hypothetical protein